MIKKICEFSDINGGLPPFLSVINTDFLFSRSASDGAYFQEIDGEKTLLFSFRGVTATICRLSEKADTDELTSFLDFQGIRNVLSDFFFQEMPLEERAVLKAIPVLDENNGIVITQSSALSDYEKVFDLLSHSGSFETWYPLFSSKINEGCACAVYMTESGAPVSCAAAPFVYDKSAVIAGVFTSENYRNKGYATKCVKTLLNELCKMGIRDAYLWCEDKNIKLYENIGFSTCGKIYVKKEE